MAPPIAAADQIEADGKEIERLEAALRELLSTAEEWQADDGGGDDASIVAARAALAQEEPTDG